MNVVSPADTLYAEVLELGCHGVGVYVHGADSLLATVPPNLDRFLFKRLVPICHSFCFVILFLSFMIHDIDMRRHITVQCDCMDDVD